MNKKYIYFLLLILIFICLIFRNELSLYGISKLIAIKNTLGKLYVERLSLKLADDGKQIRKGETEKYVLKSNDGSKWLFKVADDEYDEINTLVAYKLANILGVNTPELYEFNISINGTEKTGFIQRMLLPTNDHFSLEQSINETKVDFIPVILKNEIFSWLLGFDPGSVEILIKPTGEVYQIDLDNAFDFDAEFEGFLNPMRYRYRYLTDPQMLKEIDIDFRRAYIFLKYVDGINSYWMEDYLKLNLSQCKDQVYWDDMIKILLKRKELLSETFREKYSFHHNFSNKNFDNSNSFLYRISIWNKLCKDVLRKCIAILSLGKQNSENRNELSIVSSGSAWKYILENLNHFEYLKNETPPNFKKVEIRKSFLVTENKLKYMRRNCNNFPEKLAITMYLRQMRTLIQYIKNYNRIDNLYSGDIFIQIVQNTPTIEHPFVLDRWFSFVKYQTEGCVLPVKLKGEDEYIDGLIKLMYKQYNGGIMYLLQAQNQEYAVDEIDNIIDTYVLGEH